MEYSIIEKQAIIKLLSDMMMVDGHRDQQEEQYLNYVKRLLGLSSMSLDSTMSREKAFSVISKMSDDHKMEIAGMLQQMIMADGIQDKNEMFFGARLLLIQVLTKLLNARLQE